MKLFACAATALFLAGCFDGSEAPSLHYLGSDVGMGVDGEGHDFTGSVELDTNANMDSAYPADESPPDDGDLTVDTVSWEDIQHDGGGHVTDVAPDLNEPDSLPLADSGPYLVADSGPADSAPDVLEDTWVEPDACVPNCDGKECGPDGCGGICGECMTGGYCGEDGLCINPGQPDAGPETDVPVCGDCDDGNPCTDDSCDSDVGCVHEPNLAPCDDGNPCTIGDGCAGGGCNYFQQDFGCDDQDPCTKDYCDPPLDLDPVTALPSDVCKHDPVLEEDVGCDDNDACTDDIYDPDTCGCQHVPIVCDVQDPCTVGVCDPSVGCVEPQPLTNCKAWVEDDPESCPTTLASTFLEMRQDILDAQEITLSAKITEDDGSVGYFNETISTPTNIDQVRQWLDAVGNSNWGGISDKEWIFEEDLSLWKLWSSSSENGVIFEITFSDKGWGASAQGVIDDLDCGLLYGESSSPYFQEKDHILAGKYIKITWK